MFGVPIVLLVSFIAHTVRSEWRFSLMMISTFGRPSLADEWWRKDYRREELNLGAIAFAAAYID